MVWLGIGIGIGMTVLYSAPPIPAGIHWNPQEWDRNPQEYTGIHRNGTGIRRNTQEWDQ